VRFRLAEEKAGTLNYGGVVESPRKPGIGDMFMHQNIIDGKAVKHHAKVTRVVRSEEIRQGLPDRTGAVLHALRDVRQVIGFDSGYDAAPCPREVESCMKSFAPISRSTIRTRVGNRRRAA